MSGFWKKAWKDLNRKRAMLKVVGGQNLFMDSPSRNNLIVETDEDGVVLVNHTNKFYFLGFTQERSHERNIGKAAAGAVVGTVVAPGIGTIIGGAIGGKSKNTSTASLDFATYDEKHPFTVVVECDDKMRKTLGEFKIAYLE